MDERTLTALQGSIAKWEAIVKGEASDEGEDNCPLCAMFLWAGNRPACSGCPVAEKACEPGCNGTPYREWCDYLVAHPEGSAWKAVDDKSRALAQAELDFLRSLLPRSQSISEEHQ